GLAELPLSKFYLRYTIRFYPPLAFCAILAGGLMLERMLAIMPRRWTCELLFGGFLLGTLTYHVAMCQPSFYNYGIRPYPELPREFEEVFHPHADKQLVDVKNSRRIASWAPLRSPSPDFHASLPLNLPHYYQVPSIFGYDPVVEGQPRIAEVYRRLANEPAAAYKAYGVGWHLFRHVEHSPNKASWRMEKTVQTEAAYLSLPKADLQIVAEFHGTELCELPGVDALAFADARPDQPLPMRLH